MIITDPIFILKNYLNFKKKIALISSEQYLGKPTDFENVRVSLVEKLSLFYKVESNNIIIVGIWDNRRNPKDLLENLEL